MIISEELMIIFVLILRYRFRKELNYTTEESCKLIHGAHATIMDIKNRIIGNPFVTYTDQIYLELAIASIVYKNTITDDNSMVNIPDVLVNNSNLIYFATVFMNVFITNCIKYNRIKNTSEIRKKLIQLEFGDYFDIDMIYNDLKFDF